MPDPAVEVKVEPKPEPKPEPEVVAVAEPKVEAEAKPEAKPAAKSEDWRDRRIAELTAKLNAERDKTAAAPLPVAVAGESPEALQARIDSESNRKAGEIAAAVDWNNRCNAVNDQGLKEFPDFADRLKVCQSVVNFSDRAEFEQFNSVLAAAMETGQAHKLIHDLGSDAGEVRRLMGLPPMKMAMEMATKAAKLGAGPPAEEPSGAPKPLTPVGSKGNHYDGLDTRTVNGTKLPIAQWMKQREKQAEEAGIQ